MLRGTEFGQSCFLTLVASAHLILRCFPHVINIAVQTALKVLSDLPDLTPGVPPHDVNISAELAADPQYWAVLQSDVVGLARSLVTACRASGQRRDDFEQVLEEGNNRGGWGDPPELLRIVGLLKDVDTRWSSIFLMIDRVLELYQVCFPDFRLK